MRVANELELTLNPVYPDTNITFAFAGKTPEVGSNRTPQLFVMVAFSCATMFAVDEFWQTPLQAFPVVAQVTFKFDVFKAVGPTANRTISFCPSVPLLGVHAATRIDSMLKH